jgi:hypothetical protein
MPNNLTFLFFFGGGDAATVEAQAIDRVHRIGQKEKVLVTKLMIKVSNSFFCFCHAIQIFCFFFDLCEYSFERLQNSVEDRVIEIQKRKLQQIQEAYSGHKYNVSFSNRLDREDLRLLFSK